MVEDVVSAKVFGVADELREFVLRSCVEFLFRFDESPIITNSSAVSGDFCVDEGDNVILLRR